MLAQITAKIATNTDLNRDHQEMNSAHLYSILGSWIQSEHSVLEAIFAVSAVVKMALVSKVSSHNSSISCVYTSLLSK